MRRVSGKTKKKKKKKGRISGAEGAKKGCGREGKIRKRRWEDE